MRSASLLAAALAVGAAGCGSSGKPAAFAVSTGENVLAVSVNGRCGSAPYVNEPCVSATVCLPGSASCQVVDGLLLDTGSYGLRIFKQALTLALPGLPAPGGGALAECVQYADLSADWGPVVSADVILGGEPAVRVPVQVIDAAFGTVPPSCPSPETAPTAFNGILGVGVFVEDCGPSCPASANMYFSSSGGTTTAVTVDASLQVQNPVGLLPRDNNGIILSLPGVPPSGARSLEGALVLGIGTRPNNIPVSASAIALDGAGDFTTRLGGAVLAGSFVDSGSNGLFFPPPSAIAACGTATGFYCPPSPLPFTATNGPSSGFPGNTVQTPFEIANLEALAAGGNAVFANAGGTAVRGAGFDWGLPFFLGRTVYLGIAGRSTVFGNGPTLAY